MVILERKEKILGVIKKRKGRKKRTLYLFPYPLGLTFWRNLQRIFINQIAG